VTNATGQIDVIGGGGAASVSMTPHKSIGGRSARIVLRGLGVRKLAPGGQHLRHILGDSIGES
jgi:hypothetical protein